MQILDIRIYPVPNGKALKARVDITLGFGDGGEITMKGFRVHDDGKKGPWVAVPSERFQRNGKTEFKDTAFLSRQAQSQIYPKIIEKYKALILNP